MLCSSPGNFKLRDTFTPLSLQTNKKRFVFPEPIKKKERKNKSITEFNVIENISLI